MKIIIKIQKVKPVNKILNVLELKGHQYIHKCKCVIEYLQNKPYKIDTNSYRV